MHVALVSPAWPPEKYTNGIVTYVHSLREELNRAGHTVSVFSSKLADPEPGVFQVRQSRSRQFVSWVKARTRGEWIVPLEWGFAIAGTVAAVHRSTPIDVIEMEESFGWAADVGRSTGIPTVVKLHGPAFKSLLDEKRQTRLGAARIVNEGKALRRQKILISPAQTTLDDTVSFYGLEPELSVHIPNPLKLPPSAPLWSLSTCDRHTLLFVGRFDTLKGGDIVLRAFAQVLESQPNMRLIFVGPDTGVALPSGQIVHFDELKSELFPACTERVEFRGKLPPNEIYDLRIRCLATIVASRWENQSYTALEAMLQGCPVVSTDAGGQGEIIEHGVRGLLAKSCSAEDLADKLLSLIAQPDWAARLGAGGRAYVLERHAPDRIMKETLEVYESAIRLKVRK